jgi:hypothetical protein
MAWDGSSSKAKTIELGRVVRRIESYDMKIEVEPSQVAFHAWGELPVQGTFPKSGLARNPITATVVLTQSGWNLRDARVLTPREESSILKVRSGEDEALNQFSNVEDVRIVRNWTTSNGDIYVGVERREDAKTESVLLRSKPAPHIWPLPPDEILSE